VKGVAVSADILRAQRRVDEGTDGSVGAPWVLLDQERELSRRKPSLLCLRLKLAKQGCFHPRDVLPKQSTASAGFRMAARGRWVNG
jgi:hypothetical protein